MNLARVLSPAALLLVLCAALAPAGLLAQFVSILDTKHNLSVTGPGPVKALLEEEVCIFCHTPHFAAGVPLWNRADSRAQYLPYESSTLRASPGQPTGASKLCLSCHDGTIALGAVGSRSQEIPFVGGVRFMPPGSGYLGTDLRDDHPISFLYDSNLAASHPGIRDPASIQKPAALDANGELQCTSCHEPHSNQYGAFLVGPNAFSAVCTACHLPPGWPMASHGTSQSVWNGNPPDPWPNTEWTTVAENACLSCHRPHSANGMLRLLGHAVEEDNCFPCHNGNVAQLNLETVFQRPFRHPIAQTTGVHDPVEDPRSMARHVECADCHDPHAANSAAASAPNAPGALAGVSGVDSEGRPVPNATFTYEVCYKCHADTATGAAVVPRLIVQMNTRLEFDPGNPSFHPVEAPGRNQDVPSLMPPLTTASVISCTDCHDSESSRRLGRSGPAGPHGSLYRPMLAGNYSTEDFTFESSLAYELCYRCHSRTSILDDRSFKKHKQHVQAGRIPCSACHDSHGVNAGQGTPSGNTHLINFDARLVAPDPRSGRLQFEDLGQFRGRCYLVCHGKNHDPKEY
ncbi:MAG: hypothetical protein HY717_09060 [Planctomycetes bacterium]|nr:hypothetical protein [Planctomycetota bacterium]